MKKLLSNRNMIILNSLLLAWNVGWSILVAATFFNGLAIGLAMGVIALCMALKDFENSEGTFRQVVIMQQEYIDELLKGAKK